MQLFFLPFFLFLVCFPFQHSHCFLLLFSLSTSTLFQAPSSHPSLTVFLWLAPSHSLSLPLSRPNYFRLPSCQMATQISDLCLCFSLSLIHIHTHPYMHTHAHTHTHTHTHAHTDTKPPSDRELMHKHTQEEDIKQACSPLIFY